MHIMVDLETLGVSPHATILSIGAVSFDPFREEPYKDKKIDDLFPHQKFYIVLQENQSREIDSSTIDWWDSQGPEAKSVFSESIKVPLREGLNNYNRFVKSHKGEKVWCKGATFDHTILTDAFRQFRLPEPVGFRDKFCSRTLLELAKMKGKQIDFPSISGMIGHNSLHDAIYQAIVVQKVLGVI